MKELYRKNQWVLAILDANNYVVYDHTKPKVDKRTGKVSYEMNFYISPYHAIREVSRRLANEVCHDLESWLEALQDYQNELETLLAR